MRSTVTWYHGSDVQFDVLRPGSTITQNRSLAEAFSHRPTRVWIDDDGTIEHNGVVPGHLYTIDEPVHHNDIRPVPGSTMAPGLEWHTCRPLRVKLLCYLP